jgi:hypothetical protein
MNAASGARRGALALYPPSFRRRYGDELDALVDGAEATWREVADLAKGAARAWAFPTFAGDADERRRARLQATTMTVLVAWCASVVAGAGFAKAVDDPPLPGLHGATGTVYDTGAVVLEVTAGVVLATGFVFWLALVAPAWRARTRAVVVPAFAPAVIVATWLGITGLVALYVHHVAPGGVVGRSVPHYGVILAVLVGYLVITVVSVVGCAATAATALRRAALDAARLRWSGAVAELCAAGVSAQALCAAIVFGALVRHGLDSRDAATAGAALVVCAASGVMAAVSGARAFGALRAPGDSATV